MTLIKKWILGSLLGFVIFHFCFFNPGFSQVNKAPGLKIISKKFSFNQDTAIEHRKRTAVTSSEPDTNFTWEKYGAFLTKISDTNKYVVLPLNEFRTTINNNKILIGLRHDVDIDLNVAFNFSETESKLGFRSTYFILHTAPYYLANPNNMAIHTDKILPVLKIMQDTRKFEIGWHNDLVTLQAVYNIDPVTFLNNELDWLRSDGIRIYGTASHGSSYCYIYKYLNFYFFEECTYPVVGQFVNNLTLPIGGKNVPMKKGKMSDFNLEYEAYFLNNNKYFSDATITNGIRWNIGMLDLNLLKPGDRVIILLHPIHWHKASVNTNIESFRINGQTSSSIDINKSTISVLMPYGANMSSLKAVFTLSAGAFAKVSGKMQVSGTTSNNFNTPLIYTVYAENRDVMKNWTVSVIVDKNKASDFLAYSSPGWTKSVSINKTDKTILLEVNEGADIKHLQVQFELSPGARSWIGNTEQFSKTGTLDFSGWVQYRVLAEDGITSSTWTVYLLQNLTGMNDVEGGEPGLSLYPNPTDGSIHLSFRNIMTFPTKIDIYNSSGEEILSRLISKTGNFTVEENLKKVSNGFYILKYSKSVTPVVFIVRRR
jgi:hypothetical protein